MKNHLPAVLLNLLLTEDNSPLNPSDSARDGEMTNKPPTANSKGLRFGSFVQIRDAFQEEFEAMLAGKQDAKQALDRSVQRGNELLRRFEKTAKE